METEIEAKWLDVDVRRMQEKLKAAGATLIQPERLMKRKTYDYPDKRLSKIGGWARVRDEGNKVTLSYKQLNDRSLHGTKEITVTVDGFAGTCSFLEAIGLEQQSFQETKRESWKLGEAEVEIDTWPWIPSFVEIEAPDEAALQHVAAVLGLDYKAALHGSVETAYQAVYDVTDEEINGWEEVRFSDTPEWLAVKARK